jgi:NTP pyrophosphatase (non-canonical NTP hydrolase)
MATLYELDKAYGRVIETGFAWDDETGEVTYDSSDLEALEGELADKLTACGCWVKNQQALADAIREEEKALKARRETIERKLERMSGYVVQVLGKMPNGRLDAPEVALSTRKSVRVVIDDAESLPREYVTETVTHKIDRAGIKAALKAGEVEGAHLEARDNLRVR